MRFPLVAARNSARHSRSAAAAPGGCTTVCIVGRLIAIEGVDGSGKQTLAEHVATQLRDRGRSVACTAFPRYASNVHAALVGEALHGAHGDLACSVHGMAVLNALDQRDAADNLRSELRTHDVVLLDRYVASNASYGAARLHQDAHGDFVAWVWQLEIERFALPRPDLQLLLSVPTAIAAQRAAHRERTQPGRGKDGFESDASLQERCVAVYEQLAAENWWSPWWVLDGTSELDFVRLADVLLRDSAEK